MFLKNKIVILIVVATIIRCIIALTIDLGNDEVYYINYAHHLQWNYFDHPPMVALLIKLTTLNLGLTSDFFIRLGPILLAAVNTYLIYAITKKIKNEKSGLIAALLFTSSIYSSIIAGIFIMPDAPQLFFWICSLYFLTNIITSSEDSKTVNQNLLLFGICTGLCIMSKVHGVFLWFGFGLYILFYDRKKLLNPYLYLAILLSVLILSPILFWNIDNDFITYTFHSNRVAIDCGINIDSFLREFLGGAMYNNPINYFLIGTALVATWKNKINLKFDYIRLLLFQSLPLILILLSVSLFRDTLPHWSGPGFTALIILTACYLSDIKTKLSKVVFYAIYLTLGVSFVGIVVINFYPGTLGAKNEANLGQGDVTLDMYDWNYFKTEFKKFQEQNKSKNATSINFIINNKWFPGSHIDNYIAQPLGLNFVALGTLGDIHTYEWLNKYRLPLKKGDNAYYITVSNNFSNPNEIYADKFKKINSPTIIRQFRNKKPTRNMLVYLMEEYKGE
jgi:4-amino-4-deoxy-L-arabinose transferase-like glycosyltransferase